MWIAYKIKYVILIDNIFNFYTPYINFGKTYIRIIPYLKIASVMILKF